MKIRGVVVKLVVFAVLSFLATALIWSTLRNDVSGGTRSHTATFLDASGLRTGDDVRISGVKVGRVDGLELVGTRAQVTFTVQSDQTVYTNTRAEIRYQNLVGQRYLALRKGPGPARPLADGGAIPVDRTAPSLDLSALFNGFQPLFEVLNPAQINRLSENIIQALQGSGPALRTLLNETAEVTANLADRDEIIGEVITKLTPVLEHLSRKGAEFKQVIRQSRALVKGLTKESETIYDALASVDRVSRAANGFFTDIRPALRADIAKFNQVAGLYLDAEPELEATLRELPDFLGAIPRITGYGSWVNLYACSLDVTIVPAAAGVLPRLTGTTHSEVCR